MYHWLVHHWHQAITWTNADVLFIGPLRMHVIDILIKIWKCYFNENTLKMSFAKFEPLRSEAIGLTHGGLVTTYVAPFTNMV